MTMQKRTGRYASVSAVFALSVLAVVLAVGAAAAQTSNLSEFLIQLSEIPDSMIAAILAPEEGALAVAAQSEPGTSIWDIFIGEPELFLESFDVVMDPAVTTWTTADFSRTEPNTTPADETLWRWISPGADGYIPRTYGVGYRFGRVLVYVLPLVIEGEIEEDAAAEHPSREIAGFISDLGEDAAAALRSTAVLLSEMPLGEIRVLIAEQTLREFVTAQTSYQFSSEEYQLNAVIQLPENETAERVLPIGMTSAPRALTSKPNVLVFTDATWQNVLLAGGNY